MNTHTRSIAAAPSASAPSQDVTAPSRARLVMAAVLGALPESERGRQLCWTDRLPDLGLTSLRLLGLIVELEEQFELSEQALAVLSEDYTLGTLVQLCLRTESIGDDPLAIH